MNTSLFSSSDQSWETPQPFFDALNRHFCFDLDVCATPLTAKTTRYCVPPEAVRAWGRRTFRRIFTHALVDGLAQPWTGRRCWMNPPYGREIGAWVAKARREAEAGSLIVGLLPARTDAAWWQDNVQGHADVRFVRGRLKFGNAANSAPFPSAIAVWWGWPVLRGGFV